MRYLLPLFFFLSLSLLHAQPSSNFAAAGEKHEFHPDWAEIFESHGYKGGILLYDTRTGIYHSFDSARTRQRFVPASTFKIFNGMVGLETGAIPDTNFVMKWDGVKRFAKRWNQDLTMGQAFRYSAAWYFQKLFERVGHDPMQSWLNREHYGNRAIGDGGMFWLSGPLRVSQWEQVRILRRLYSGQLGFSSETMNTMKALMRLEADQTCVLRAKTGWGEVDGIDYGWFVGWVERDGAACFFATLLETTEASAKFETFGAARVKVTQAVMEALGWGWP